MNFDLPMIEPPLVNRVVNSGLVTIDLEELYPAEEIVPFDLKGYLFMEMILREKDFREALKAHDWEQYRGKNLAVFCSVDAVIPLWAYMLVATHAATFVQDIGLCEPTAFVEKVILKKLATFDIQPFVDKRIVIKGCGEKPVPASAYIEITRLLQPVALSIMFGEPCSTVPVYKKTRV